MCNSPWEQFTIDGVPKCLRNIGKKRITQIFSECKKVGGKVPAPTTLKGVTQLFLSLWKLSYKNPQNKS